MFCAALISLSIFVVPQLGQSQCLMVRSFKAGFLNPQQLHNWLDGKNLSTFQYLINECKTHLLLLSLRGQRFSFLPLKYHSCIIESPRILIQLLFCFVEVVSHGGYKSESIRHIIRRFNRAKRLCDVLLYAAKLIFE